MKRRWLYFIVALLFISGCSSLVNQATFKPTLTNNGTVIFSSTKDINKLCNKTAIDSFLSGRNPEAMTEEYQITNYDKLLYDNIKNKYTQDAGYPEKCSYRVYYYDFIVDSNSVNVAQLDLQKGEFVDVLELNKNKELDVFKKKKELTVVEAAVQYLLQNNLKETNENERVLSDELAAPESGNYQLVAQPVFRIYHLKDTKLINDYNISGIIGLKFKLEKIK